MFLVILLIVPLLVNAKIVINITIHSLDDVKIKCSGSDAKIVTNKQLGLFNVTMERLNKGMRVELGKVPDDIFLKDPTVFGDIFAKYKWEPVRRRLRVHNYKIIDIIAQDVVLKTHEFVNNSTLHVKYERSSHETIENTVHSLWTSEGLPEDEMYYTLGFNFSYGYFQYDNKWRQDKMRGSKMTINATDNGVVVIKPYQTIVTKLIATKTIVLIEFEYKAELDGAAVANFGELYGKYHFWAPSIGDIMKAGKMKNEILTREQIEIKCFVNPRLDVRYKTTGEIVEFRKRRPKIKILRNKNMRRILYTRYKNEEHKIENKKYLKL